MAGFPHFTFGGRPAARGLACGEALRERIRETYSLYADSLFSTSPLGAGEIETRAGRVRELIAAFEPAYVEELDALARGAGLPAWQIYTLNARTEILNARVPECTAAYFAERAVLGQTWDWVAPLESLAVLITWELENGHRILAFTEPGMLGKIGMNDAGIGVCLNILFSAHELDGVPVHVLTRAVLDCRTLDEARALLTRSGLGKSSHLLVADANGACCSTEFAAGERFELASRDGVLVHTNHCIAPGAAGRAAMVPTSAARLERATSQTRAVPGRGVAAMKTILLDDAGGAGSPNVAYHPEPLLDNQPTGTVATFVMDLPARRLHAKRGPGPGDRFETFELQANA